MPVVESRRDDVVTPSRRAPEMPGAILGFAATHAGFGPNSRRSKSALTFLRHPPRGGSRLPSRTPRRCRANALSVLAKTRNRARWIIGTPGFAPDSACAPSFWQEPFFSVTAYSLSPRGRVGVRGVRIANGSDSRERTFPASLRETISPLGEVIGQAPRIGAHPRNEGMRNGVATSGENLAG